MHIINNQNNKASVNNFSTKKANTNVLANNLKLLFNNDYFINNYYYNSNNKLVLNEHYSMF